MAGYIGNKSQTLVDGYTTTEADAEFVNDPNDVITVSGGNVGIGTSSPLTNFHTSTTGATTAYIETTGGTNSWSRVTLATPAQKWAWTHANGYNNNRLELYNETSNNVPVAIDTAGRVTMPYQPSFYAYNDSTWSSTGTLVLPSVYQNTGGHYNTSNGVFTAPVGGVYHFSFNFVSNNSTSYIWGGFHVNGTGIRADFHTTGASEAYNQRSLNVSIYLNANDTFNIYIGGIGGGSLQGARHNFSGFLVG